MEPVTAAATAPWWAPAVVGGAIGLGSGIISSAFNMREGEKNRDFQERMSSTAHQRQIADMEKAGLNPLLSAKQGGSSTPGGSQAQMTMPDLVNSAVNMASAGAQIRDTNSAAALKDVQALDIAKTLPPRLANILADSALKRNTSAVQYGEMLKQQPYLDESESIRKQIRSDAQHSALDLNRAESESKFYDDVGQFSPYVNFLKQLIGTGRR